MSTVDINAQRDLSIAGDVVGRDKIIHHHHYGEKKERPAPRMAPPAPRVFIGRDEMLRELIVALKLGEDGAGPIALTALKGMGGIGKTTLAAALANHPEVEAALPEGTLWAGLGPEPEVMSLLAEWGNQLGEDFAKLDSPETRSRRLSTLLHDKKALLIVDDVWHAEPARYFLVGGPRCRALITTRNNEIARKLAGHEAVRVETLTDAASLNLLRELAQEAVAADEKAANELATALDGLPLALTLAGQMVAAEWEAGLGVAGALSELKDREARLKLAGAEKRAGLAMTEPSLRAILAMSYDRLPDEATKRAFRLLGVFGGKPLIFSIEAAPAVWGMEFCPAQKIMVALVARALVEPVESGRYTLHTTLADFAESLLDEHGEAMLARETHAKYYLQFAQKNAKKNWRAVEMEIDQIRKGFLLADRGTDKLMACEYYWTIRSFFDRRGLWSEAMQWAERVLILVQSLKDRASEARLLKDIGYTYRRKRAWREALIYFQRSLAIYEAIHNLAGQIVILNLIGHLYTRKGLLDDALLYYERSLKIQKENNDQAGLASTLNNIGVIYENRGLWDEALEYHERSRVIREQIGDQRGLASSFNNIGIAYTNIGILDRALEYHKRSQMIYEQLDDLYSLADTVDNLGSVSYKQGMLDQALEYFKCSRRIREEIGDRGRLPRSLIWIGYIYAKKGLWDKALEYYENCRIIREEIGDRIKLPKLLNSIGVIYKQKALWDAALAQYERSRTICEEINDRPGLAKTLCYIGDVYEKTGQITDAEQVLTQAIAIFESLGSPDLENARKQLDKIRELQQTASQK